MNPEALRQIRAQIRNHVDEKRAAAERAIEIILRELAAETDTAIESIEVRSVIVQMIEDAAPKRIFDGVTINLEKSV